MSKNIELIHKLLLENKPYSYIMNEVGCAKSTVSYHAKKLGLLKFSKTKYDWVSINKYYHSKDAITVQDCIEKFGFSRSTWAKAIERGDLTKKERKTPNIDIFKINSTYARSKLKNRILQDNLIPYVCSGCGNSGVWNNKPLVLQLDHINGISDDCRLKNLTFVCPNCHSQTDTYAGKNLNNPNRKPKPYYK